MRITSIEQEKQRIRSLVGEKLSREEKEEALRDHHAHRPPRPCGMTIHTGIGCTLRCIYCYIEDMGFKWGIKPYPLTPLQLVYALASNPYFIPGRNGTLIAIGSVTEPFLPETREKTLGYIEAIAEYLGNPIQFSTKMTIDEEAIKRMTRADPGISPLVTIITFKYHDKLEPYAPPPHERLEIIKKMARHGLKPILFYRPIIPGISEEEYPEILREAKKHGAIGVVAGSLRVTPRILSRLQSVGIPVEEIKKRLPRPPRPREQVSVDTRDIKKEIMEYASSIGLVAFPEACMANLYTHGYTCWRMQAYGIRAPTPPPGIDVEEIRDTLRNIGLKHTSIHIDRRRGVLYLSLRERVNRRDRKVLEEYIRCRYRICVRIKY